MNALVSCGLAEEERKVAAIVSLHDHVADMFEALLRDGGAGIVAGFVGVDAGFVKGDFAVHVCTLSVSIDTGYTTYTVASTDSFSIASFNLP